jgi:integration host factor subunit beta
MTKSELIERISKKQSYLNHSDVERTVKCILKSMTEELSIGGRVEIRGFGSFSLRHYASRMARNPRTGEVVLVKDKYALRFKAGLELSQRVRKSEHQYNITP